MKIGYWNGWAVGYVDGQNAAEKAFERELAILREELADVRRDRDAQLTRGDAACDLLLGHLGARAISLAGKAEEVQRTERNIRNVEAVAAAPDPFDLPLGHPSGRYSSAAEAALTGGDEDIPAQERAH